MPPKAEQDTLDAKDDGTEGAAGESDSSTLEQDATTDGGEASGDESSTSQDADDETEGGEATLADVVKDAAAASGSAESSTETEEKEESEEEESAEASKKDGEAVLLDEEDKKLPFHKHPRFQAVIKERNTLRTEAETLRAPAERAKAVDEFCQKHGITTKEFADVMELTALVHVDPAKALERLRGFVDNLEVSVGNKLPSDLQKEVDEGTLSVERAKELTKARLRASGLEQSAQQTAAQQQAQVQRMITDAVNAWDQQKRTADAGYVSKYPLVDRAFIALCAIQPPRTPQEAIALAEQALNEVNASLAKFIPRPPKRKVLPTHGTVSKADIEIDPNEDLRTALPKIARRVVATHRG